MERSTKKFREAEGLGFELRVILHLVVTLTKYQLGLSRVRFEGLLIKITDYY